MVTNLVDGIFPKLRGLTCVDVGQIPDLGKNRILETSLHKETSCLVSVKESRPLPIVLVE